MLSLRRINNNKFILLLLPLFISFSSAGQEIDERYDEIVIRNRIFKPYSGYITISTGPSYNPGLGSMEKAFSLGYHFRIKDYHFHTGYHVTSDKFFMNRSYQMMSDIYLLCGYRKETIKSNINISGGPVYGFGSTLDSVHDINGTRTNYYLYFHKIGLYAEAEYTYKLTYDFGIGLSAYVSANKAYQVAGLKIHLYFSGAYKGSIE